MSVAGDRPEPMRTLSRPTTIEEMRERLEAFRTMGAAAYHYQLAALPRASPPQTGE